MYNCRRKEFDEVLSVIKKYKTTDPFIIADKLGFIIERKPLGNLKAYYRISKRNKFITLNDNLESHEEIVECHHELGHYFMHREFNTFMLSSIGAPKDRFENEAHRFAVYMILQNYDASDLEGLSINQISMLTGLEIYKLNLIT